MPPRLELVQRHLAGKAFARARLAAEGDFAQFEPYVVPHAERADKLFCLVTRRTLNRDEAEVRMHVNGRRYLNSLERYQRRMEDVDESMDDGNESDEERSDGQESLDEKGLTDEEDDDEMDQDGPVSNSGESEESASGRSADDAAGQRSVSKRKRPKEARAAPQKVRRAVKRR
mmetsp:Transcript_40791/g.100354  ORF Transcript_40791/g.100354 Transcript_40791/m.100354 type:complete len:173 (-) Transcript_40791:171-689(-)